MTHGPPCGCSVILECAAGSVLLKMLGQLEQMTDALHQLQNNCPIWNDTWVPAIKVR